MMYFPRENNSVMYQILLTNRAYRVKVTSLQKEGFDQLVAMFD